MAARVALLFSVGVFFIDGLAFAHAEAGDEVPRKQVVVETRVIAMPENCHEDLGDENATWCRIEWTRKHGIESALLDDLKLFRVLGAVQGHRRAHIMQLPRLTVLDGQDATIAAGAIRAGYRPMIAGDERCVALQAEVGCKGWPEIGSTSPGAEFSLAVNAKVPDQRTIAITARTMTIETREEYSPYPLLGQIPYVNRLFRTVGWSRETVKIIVL